MGWCLDHSDASRDVVDIIAESLTIDHTPIPKKMARSDQTTHARARRQGAARGGGGSRWDKAEDGRRVPPMCTSQMRVMMLDRSACSRCVLSPSPPLPPQSVRGVRHFVQLVRADPQRLLLPDAVPIAPGADIRVDAPRALQTGHGTNVGRRHQTEGAAALPRLERVGALPAALLEQTSGHV